MRIATMKRTACLLLCLLLCMTMMGSALALADSGGDTEPNIAIRITPPSGWASQKAEVEVRITDHAGTGFQSVQVKAGGKSWRDVTGELEQSENRCYCVVEITENCTVTVRVAGPDGKTYEKSQYVQCFNTASDDRSSAASGQGSTSITPGEPSGTTASRIPAGQGTVVDNAAGADGREFFTISTQDENTFYLIIDRQKESENVYFLDTVKETDLLSLADKNDDSGSGSVSAVPEPEPVCTCTDKCVPGEVKRDCTVCVLSLSDCTGKAAVAPDADPTPAAEEKGSSPMILVALAALAAGGAGYYLKIYKPRHDLDDAEDLDALTGEDEETIDEDELESVPRYAPYSEPDEPERPEDGE